MCMQIDKATLLELITHHCNLLGICAGELIKPSNTEQKILEAVQSVIFRCHSQAAKVEMLTSTHVARGMRCLGFVKWLKWQTRLRWVFL